MSKDLTLLGLGVTMLVSLGFFRTSPSENSKEISMTLGRGKGIIDTPSNHSVDQTVERLKGILEAKLQQPGIPPGATRHTAGVAPEHRRSGNFGSQSGGVAREEKRGLATLQSKNPI